MKYILLGLFIFSSILYFSNDALKKHTKNPEDLLRFSNTGKWDTEFLGLANRTPTILKDWESRIAILPPPANSSKETSIEIGVLINYKNLRTPAKIAEINNELDINTIEIGGRAMRDYFNFSKYPETALLFANTYTDLNIIIMKLKKKYDRVRPSVLNPEVEPIIPDLAHPAYPSGYSTQTYFMAYMLAEILPEKKDELLAEAERISRNREIAGVHYPSDTEAGKLLARQFLDILLTNKNIQESIVKSRSELQGK